MVKSKYALFEMHVFTYQNKFSYSHDHVINSGVDNFVLPGPYHTLQDSVGMYNVNAYETSARKKG